jgi:DNA segregation ATPase FtsK/SpoIIIE, S-DNA-T family
MSRKKSLYSLPKLKLKHKTIISVATFVSFILAGITAAAFLTNTQYLSFWRQYLIENIGFTAFLAPVLFVLIGLVLQKVKWAFAQMNVLLGLIVMMVALMGLLAGIGDTPGGILGAFIWVQISAVVTSIFAALILIIIFAIGLVVFLNTSLEQLMAFFGSVFSGAGAAAKATTKVGGVFKRNEAFDAKGGQMKLSGIDDRLKVTKAPEKQVRGEPVLAETLVQNVAGQARVWKYPPLSLLSDKGGAPADRGDVKKNAAIIERTLESFGIQARVAEVNGGPAVTQYALEIAAGTKITKIANLQHDIALALATRTGTVRIEAPIPGKSLVGIEVPNHTLEIVTLKSVLGSDELRKRKSKLAVPLGKDTASNPIVVDIDKMPHTLVAGTTGSGKSILMHNLITSLLFRNSPDELKLILIDPKRVEMTNYNNVPHLLTPVIVEPEKILSALKWAMAEMDRRYKLFQQVGVRNIQGYNEMSGFQALPYIVIFIDELADLMMFAPVEVEDAITRLAQLARATGIHLVIATQRPSVDVITGLMKANIPSRIAFNVSSMIDSRVIIDTGGAEKLLGRGDMLFMPPDASKPQRIQGVLVTDAEISNLVNYLKSLGIAPHYTEEITQMPIGKIGKGKGSSGNAGGDEDRDGLFEEAVRTVCQYDRASASLLQRRLKVGYARAARIIDELETAGVIGPGDGSKPRDVLVRNADEFLNGGASSAEGSGMPEQY